MAAKSVAALSDRLERYWDSLRMEAIYSREFGIKALENTTKAQPQSECRNWDDEPRWLIALNSDTGMRFAESWGLHTWDINLKTDTPHIDVIGHPGRGLKNSNLRQNTMVDASLWAADQI